MTAERDEFDLTREANEPLDDADAALLAQIRAVYEVTDPVPAHLATRLEFELTLAAMFDEVARLQQVESTFSGARTTAEQIKTITFSGSDVSLMLTINEVAEGQVRIDGWVAPGTGWNVAVAVPGDAGECRTTATDSNGRFVFSKVPADLAQFSLHRGSEGSERAFTTPLIQL